VAVADNDDDFDTRRVMTSSDGSTWTMRESADDVASWNCVTYGNGMFVAVAHDRIMTSSNGFDWTLRESPAVHPWWSVGFGNGLFVAVAWAGTGGRAMSSPDGVEWALRPTSSENSGWYSVAFGSQRFVAVAISGSTRVMSWDVSPEVLPASTFLSVARDLITVGNMRSGNLSGVGNVVVAGNVSVGGDSLSIGSSTISSPNAGIVFDAASYLASSGRMRHSSYVQIPSVPVGLQSRRDYAMSCRFWSGRVNGSYILNCNGNSAYPLYGVYTVFYMTKAGTYDCEMFNCFRGSTGSAGNTNTLTWNPLSSISSNTAGLSVVFGSSTWLPTITFSNSTPFHAYFQVHAFVFDESFAFSQPGV